MSRHALDPRCVNCVRDTIGGNAIPTCLTTNCLKIAEYYPGKDALDVTRAVWKEFTERIKPKE